MALPHNGSLAVENEEHPISDVLDIPTGKNHIRPYQVNKEAMASPPNLLISFPGNCPLR